MNDDLTLVRALLARAAHPHTPEEEARTAAVLAARLIAEGQMAVVKAEGVPAFDVWPGVRKPSADEDQTFERVDFRSKKRR